MCRLCICNFQLIIRCLIYVASFEFIFKSVHSSFTATKHAQTRSRRGKKQQLTRSAWHYALTNFYRRSHREPGTTLFTNKTLVPNLCLVNTISHLTSGKTNTRAYRATYHTSLLRAHSWQHIAEQSWPKPNYNLAMLNCFLIVNKFHKNTISYNVFTHISVINHSPTFPMAICRSL